MFRIALSEIEQATKSEMKHGRNYGLAEVFHPRESPLILPPHMDIAPADP